MGTGFFSYCWLGLPAPPWCTSAAFGVDSRRNLFAGPKGCAERPLIETVEIDEKRSGNEGVEFEESPPQEPFRKTPKKPDLLPEDGGEFSAQHHFDRRILSCKVERAPFVVKDLPRYVD